MSIVFKIFRPNGECRRVPFQTVPSIEDVNNVAKELVPWSRVDNNGAANWKLTYKDSEGDTILIVTSEDLANAVLDAQETGAKSVKIVVRRATGNCGRPDGARAGRCGAHHHCRNKLFSAWNPREMAVDLSVLPDKWKAVVKHWHAACGGFNIINDEAVENHHNDGESSSESTDTSKPVAEESVAPTASAAEVPEEDSTAAATSNAPVPAASSHSQEFTFVEREQPRADSETADSSGEIERKAELLKEMGFNLPRDMAHNMIRELNGRMDLVVRALVANNSK